MPTTADDAHLDAGTGLTGFPLGSAVTVAGTPPTTYHDHLARRPWCRIRPATGATLTINNRRRPAGSMNGVTVTISGTPADGDTFTDRPEHRRDQRRPQRAAAVEPVHREGRCRAARSTLTSAYANYVNNIGNQASQVQTSSTAQSALVTQITAAQQSVSGVNINEEAANLLQYQQLYQANSKVIQTAQTLFQTILGIFSVRR